MLFTQVTTHNMREVVKINTGVLTEQSTEQRVPGGCQAGPSSPSCPPLPSHAPHGHPTASLQWGWEPSTVLGWKEGGLWANWTRAMGSG